MKEDIRKTESDALKNALFEALFFLAAAVLPALSVFAEGMNMKDLCRTGCWMLISAGAVLSLKYLFGKGYLRFWDYSFSAGVLMIVLGICGVIRADELDVFAGEFFSLLTLIIGVYFLQVMIQFIKLDTWMWIPVMSAAMLAIASAVIGLMNGRFILDHIFRFREWALLISSLTASLTGILSAILVQKKRKRMKKAEEEATQRIEEEMHRTKESASGEENTERTVSL